MLSLINQEQTSSALFQACAPANAYPDILNDPDTPLKVVECFFLLRDNEFHTLYYIVTQVLKGKFSAEEIAEAMRIYMLP